MIHSTTVLTVRRGSEVALGADGQVTISEAIVKHDASKIRRLSGGKVLVGFAGSAADALALLERFEEKLREFKGNMAQAAVALAKDWRTDKVLRPLQSMLIVCDIRATLLLSGAGDVIEPTEGVVGVGSGGQYAAAAARALLRHTDLSAEEIVREALNITSEICIYTNNKLTIEVLK